jgi:hypothetical protein
VRENKDYLFSAKFAHDFVKIFLVIVGDPAVTALRKEDGVWAGGEEGPGASIVQQDLIHLIASEAKAGSVRDLQTQNIQSLT